MKNIFFPSGNRRLIWSGALAFFLLLTSHAFAQTTRVTDNTWGDGGMRETTVTKDELGIEKTTVKLYDESNPRKLRQTTVTTRNIDNSGSVTYDTGYHPDGQKKKTYVFTKNDEDGSSKYEEYEYSDYDGSIIGGRISTIIGGERKTYPWDPKEKKFKGWENVSHNDLPKKETTVSQSNCCNNVFAGLSVISEDSRDRFLTFGPNASYTHRILNRLGLTGDAGVYFGSQRDEHFTKFLLHGGLSLLPKCGNNGVSVSPHVLAGVSEVRSKYNFDMTSFKNKTREFSLLAGLDIHVPVKNTVAVVKADYNPSISSAGTLNNFRVGIGLNFTTGCKIAKPPVEHGSYTSTKTNDECHASKETKELKISLAVIEEIAKSVETIANKIPRVEAKVAIKPLVAVKRGEECCSKDKPPAIYTEIKGGVEGTLEVNINLWGLPDIYYSIKLWPVLLIADLKCKLFVGPTGKISLEGIGKYYGELLGSDKRPDCKACFYWNLKAEGYTRLGVKVGGSLNLYHWSPFGNGKAGFDVTGEPDEKLEASAEASVSLGTAFSGTYTTDTDCKKPQAGLHGKLNIGKAKANLKFNLKLGPLSFDPNIEVPLFDGFELKF